MKYPNRSEEKRLFGQGLKLIAGIDEVGRGAWAGPIVAAAVILPQKVRLPQVADSKLLSAKRREKLFPKIIAQALDWSIGIVWQDVIDEIGIMEANLEAINQAISQLKTEPQFLLIDYLGRKKIKFYNDLPYKLIVDGDYKVTTIAAASVVAKVTRDKIMTQRHKKYPLYGFAQHKGYGTRFHQKMLKTHGPCKFHRQSFQPIKILK
jgi:ribonuclease HII